MQLKTYQTETLATLRSFFEEALISGPKAAFEASVANAEWRIESGRAAQPYVPLDGQPDTPYVCLRLPTGGGKTLLAAHAVRVAAEAWMQTEAPLVLWLVPSNTIRKQTVEALRAPRHPYRRALDERFDGKVNVLDIADFTQLRPADLEANCTIVVGTIQTLRTSNTDGRRVYAHHEDLEPHFSRIAGASGLEPVDADDPAKGPRFSFANLLHVHRPLMIVDEAHGAVTGLTRDMQKRVNPSAIIELTATPRDKGQGSNKGRAINNILHSVSAQRLKDEEMIKLPIVLSEHDSWQNAVAASVQRRAELAKVADGDPRYIRPIVLLQAQKKAKGKSTITADVLRQHLIDTEQVPERAIAVATGEQRELDGIDLFDPACPIEFVITVEALKEGWDCSFAYVFCSVSRIQSATDVEQLLGRVLRMPFAERRPDAALNKSYAHLSEPDFAAAAMALTDKLIAMGFDEQEAQANVESAQGQLGMGGGGMRPRPRFRHTLGQGDLLDRDKLPPEVRVEEDDGQPTIVSDEALSEAEEEAVVESLPEPERPGFREAARRFRHENPPSPARSGAVIHVPKLMVEVQGELELADTDLLLEHTEWSLLDHPPRMDAGEFDLRQTARAFEIDIDGRSVTFEQATAQGVLDVQVDGWTPTALAVWLEREVRAPDILPRELLRWTTDLVDHLVVKRGLPIEQLMRAKFVLARRVRERLATIRETVRTGVYQNSLFGTEAAPRVAPDHAFEFRAGMYDGQRSYRGPWRPTKHFLGPDHVPAFDGAADGDEMRCAMQIDALAEVRHWIRNVARHRNSFWLPTAIVRFYPDFVAELNDGRLLVIEYKGAHLADGPDTRRKRAIGDLWARTSGHLFAIIEKSVDGRDVGAQLRDVIKGR